MSERLGETDEQRINIQKLLPIMKPYQLLIKQRQREIYKGLFFLLLIQSL